jgi:methyl-accepting chemotaxis protein
MGWYHNLKVSHKFFLSYIIIICILLFVGGLGISNMNQMNNQSKDLYNNNLITIKDLGSIATAFHEINTNVGVYLLNENASVRDSRKEIVHRNQELIDSIIIKTENWF